LVYNKALHLRTQAWYERQQRVGYTETSSMLTEWKKQEELDFLNKVSCVPLQQGLRHLQTAFTNFFAGRTKYPNLMERESFNLIPHRIEQFFIKIYNSFQLEI
jgi:putative transposase